MDETPRRNPYRPGTGRTSAARKSTRPIGLIIAAVLEAWTALYAALTAPGTADQFRELFKGFGTEMPPATKAVLDAPGVCWFFAIAAVAQLCWVLSRVDPTPAQRRRMKLSLWVFGVVFGIAMGWAMYGIYSAIFKLDRVV